MSKTFRSGMNVIGSSAIFSVDANGLMSSNSASLSGSVTFTVGTLGNWTVSSSGISSGSITGGTVNFNSASVGGNRITTNNTIRSYNHSASGSMDIIDRMLAVTSIGLSSSIAYFVFFTATENINVSSLTFFKFSGGTSVNKLRLGLYTVTKPDDINATLTLVARSASTISGLNTTSRLYIKELDSTSGYPASYTINAGSRYAMALCQSGSSLNTILGLSVTQTALAITPPRIIGQLIETQTQGDLPASVNSSSLTVPFTALPWMRLNGTIV